MTSIDIFAIWLSTQKWFRTCRRIRRRPNTAVIRVKECPNQMTTDWVIGATRENLEQTNTAGILQPFILLFRRFVLRQNILPHIGLDDILEMNRDL